jgi:hypothetical protein
MGEFDFWQKWGLELNDRQFANVFTALGILAATSSDSQDSGQNEPQFADDAAKELYNKDLRKAIADPFANSRNDKLMVPWSFPIHNRCVKIGTRLVILSSMNPLGIAKVWESLSNDWLYSEARLRITSYPKTESIRVWFRLLFEATPPREAAYIEFDAAQAQFHLKLPLRLGYLEGNTAEASLKSARSLWPANELSRDVQIDRENANCDVLLFSGSISQLLKILLEIPVPQKTNLFIVRGSFEDDLAVMSQRLSAIAAEGRASGFVFLDPAVPDEVLGKAINRFVENLSHNQPVDVAVSEAFAKSYPTDPVIFLSNDVAMFQLVHILAKICSRLTSLPKAARPQIKSDSLRRMGIPVDEETDDVTIPETAAKKLEEHRSAIRFDSEDSGALSMANMSDAITATENEIVDEKQQQRFLQNQIFVKVAGKFVEERRAFQRGVPTHIRVRIGLPDEKWSGLAEGFPEEKLPQDQTEWRLTVVLTEPNHLKEALRKSIKLPRFGSSTECEFRIQPGEHRIFEGRITVLHRGRVLQTAVLKGNVVDAGNDIPTDSSIEFIDRIAVKSHIGDLEERRQFDLAVILNHTTDDRPRLTAIASNHAWCVDLDECKKIASDINIALSKIANSVEDYSKGVNSDKNRMLLIELANLGNALHWSIVGEQLKLSGNWPDIAKLEYIQIVSTKSDAIVPFEFIYDYEPPHDDAKPCPSWQDALTKGSCLSNCQMDKAKYVCPLGFWGIRKVVERHDLTPELAQDGKDFYLQSEPPRNRMILSLTGTAVVAASANVEDAAFVPVLSACTERLGTAPQKAKDWEDWATLVQQYKPHVLIALTHTDGDGIKATLEIGGKTIRSNQIEEIHVRPEGEEGYPLVALLGCDTSGTALEYGSHVRWFRRKGAGVVIGTIATVFGGHATKVAEMFIKGLKQDNAASERLGEVIRSIKRQALLEGMLMVLCIVAYGDADWKLQ